MIFENSLPKANFGQNIRDSPNGSLTADSRSLQTATLNSWQLGEYSYVVITVKNTESYSLRASLKTRSPEFPPYTSLKLLYYL